MFAMNRRVLIVIGVVVFLIVAGLGAAGGGVWWYAHNALENVYITLGTVNVSTQSPAGGLGPLDILARGLATDVVIDSTFDLDNRNALGATVESIDYKVRVNGREIGTGHAPDGGAKDIAPQSKTPIVARTKLPVTSLIGAGLDGLSRGESKLDIIGKARVSVWFFSVERDFQFVPQKLEGERLDRVLGGRK